MPKVRQKEIEGLPDRNEIGKAAEALIEVDKELEIVMKRREDCENNLYKVMRMHGKKSVTIDGYLFSLRIRPTREIVAISKPK